MEELLPLIIGIAWLVYTIYNKNKKKGTKKHHPDVTEESSSPSIIEQLFTDNEILKSQPYEVYGEDEESQYDEEFEQVAYESEEESSPFLKAELADFMHEGQAATIPSDTHFMEKDKDEENHTISTDFDLRKAVIFSEILNAPYIGYK